MHVTRPARVLALFVAAWTLAPDVRAQPSAAVDLAEEADLHFLRGVDRYRAGDFGGALEHLLRSNRLVPNRNVAFNIARTYEQLGRFDDAFRYYADVLAAEPDAEGRRNAEGALERIRPRVALLEVVTDPPGARVFVDRADLGSRGASPLLLALPAGPHRVLLERAGYEPAEAGPLTLTVGATETARVTLSRVLGRVELSGEPAGATVRLDGAAEVLGQVPCTIELPPGPAVLLIEAPGRGAARLPVSVEAHGIRRATVELPLLTGTVVVDADEAGALIEIDGEARGFTPAVLRGVPVGHHSVRVRRAGFRPFISEIHVDEEVEARVNAELRPANEVVGASRTAEAVEDAPASVTLVGEQEIRAFGYETVHDALSGVRGLFPSDDRTYASLGFRGFARAGDYGNRVLVTLDGRTMNDDQLGSSYVGRDFAADLGDVRRIEVIRGPGSALYGSNAFFGVINVVTADLESLAAPHAEVASGGPRLARGRVGGGAKLGPRAGFWLSAAALQGQGEDLVLEGFGDQGDLTARDADGVQAATLSGRGFLGPLTLLVGYSQRDKRIPTGAFETTLGDGRAHSKDERGFVELRFEPKLGESVDLTARAYVDAYRFRGAYPYDDAKVAVVQDRWDGLWSGGEVRVVGKAGEALRYTVGGEAVLQVSADLVSRDASGTYLDEQPERQVYSGYGVVDWRLFGPLSVSLGARVDHFSTVGAQVSPRAALVLRPTADDVIKLIAGRAFRAPSPYELRYNDGGTTQIAAEDLSPETVLTTEIEYTRSLPAELQLITGAFYNRVADLVELGTVSTESGELLQYQNVDGVVHTLGAEAEVRREWRRGWFLVASYAYQRTRVNELIDGEEITNSPAHLAALKAAAPLGNTGAILANRLRAEGPRRTRDGDETDVPLLWDVTLTGDLPDAHLSYGVGVRNLLDWRHAQATGEDLESLTVPQSGRWVYASARVTW